MMAKKIRTTQVIRIKNDFKSKTSYPYLITQEQAFYQEDGIARVQLSSALPPLTPLHDHL